jgi:hypothetical protein
MTGEAMEQQKRLWYYKRVHEAMKAATNDRRGHETIKMTSEESRVGKWWHEKK